MQQLSLLPFHNSDNPFSAVCDRLGVENNTPAWPDKFGMAITKWLIEKNVKPIRTLSLFSGAGGLDIGFSDIGFEIVDSVEIESKFCETLELNTGEGKRFRNSKVNCIDIRDFTGDNIGHIDFIIGGPPCQTFSAAGRRANGVLGTTDARGVLFKEYVRLLCKLSPKGFLFENVYGIIGAQGGKAWREIKEAFSEAGYILYYRILDAADYGVPQHRERLIIVGLKDGVFMFPRPTHGPDSLDSIPFYNARTALDGVPVSESEQTNKLRGRYAILLNEIPPGLNYSFYTEEMGHPKPIFAWRSKFSDFLYKADPNTPVRTIKASGGAYTGPFHWENRFFTYEEFKRLQTFPDDYDISGNKQTAIKQIGNSVPPQLGRMMAIAIREQVFGTEFPFDISLLRESEELTFRKRKKELTATYRKKAQVAIESLIDKQKVLPDSHKYFCTMNDLFKFTKIKESVASFVVTIDWNEKLTVTIDDVHGSADRSARVVIKARDGIWPLHVDEVNLVINSEKDLAYTVAWRAFERELVENTIKADLVQLNGYYQYQPKFRCWYESSRELPYEEVLRSVIEGGCVTYIVSTNELANMWKLPKNEVINAAEFLKSIGYEIRNHSTNPQIDEGFWLIPYAFPTLTHLSVQLWKKLR